MGVAKLQNVNGAGAAKGGTGRRKGEGGKGRCIEGRQARDEEEVGTEFGKEVRGNGREKPAGKAGRIYSVREGVTAASIQDKHTIGQGTTQKGPMDEQKSPIMAGDVKGAHGRVGAGAQNVARGVGEARAQGARARGARRGEGAVGEVARGSAGRGPELAETEEQGSAKVGERARGGMPHPVTGDGEHKGEKRKETGEGGAGRGWVGDEGESDKMGLDGGGKVGEEGEVRGGRRRKQAGPSQEGGKMRGEKA